jgi:hypothetical protein
MSGADCRRALLAGLIDHAPAFPPACLPLDQALRADLAAQESEDAWMLGRLVVSAAWVPDIPFPERVLSVVLDGPLQEDARVQALELPPGVGLRPAAEVYVEVPLVDGFEAELASIHRRGLRAKVRCGGAAQPSPHGLARFVRSCRELGLRFKATAGLHHPVRRGVEHGFLNLLAAAVFGDEEAAFAESDPAAFSLTSGAFRWRRREAGAAGLAAVRRDLVVSIGSCSFREPVDDLTALGVLPL